MPTFLLHIGPPKTATTYLQRGFRRLAPWLARQGVLYPADFGTPGHSQLPPLLAEEDAVARLAPRFEAMRASGAHTILISAEDLAPLRRPAITRLHALIGDCPVRVVYGCRRWSEIVRSRWGERIKHGLAMTLPDYCAEALAAPRENSAINYGLTLGRWGGVFGRESLRLICLTALAEAGIDPLAHFLTGLLELHAPAMADKPAPNRSRSYADSEILRELNRRWLETGRERSSQMRVAFLRQRASLELARTEASIAADKVTILFDETRPGLLRLHQSLFDEFGGQALAPHPPRRFFEPIRAGLQAASGAYLRDPAVEAELRSAFTALCGARA